MDDFAKILYRKFFLRDVLGKIAPGLIATTAFLYFVGITPETVVPKLVPNDNWRWLFFIAAVPIFHSIGLGLQIAGEWTGAHSYSPRPHHLLFIPVRTVVAGRTNQATFVFSASQLDAVLCHM